MHAQLLPYLVCPKCHSPLRLEIYETEPEYQTIQSGLLTSDCGRWYPIVRGVPRMFPEHMFEEYVLMRQRHFLDAWADRLPQSVRREWSASLRAKSQKDLKQATAESFGFEWKRFNKMFESYRQNFLNYVQPFDEQSFQGKVVLDAGCGVGRHTYWAAKFGARDVIGLDLSDAVEPAEINCRSLPNAHVVQGDIYNMPFLKPFDFSMSIGVIHHLPDPESGFQRLIKHTKSGGVVLIWIYGRLHNNTAVYVYEPLRTVTRHIPKRVLVPLCYPFAGIVEGCNQAANLLEKTKGFPKLGRQIPFQYYRQFPFEVKLNDAFDVLATPKSRYYKMETIQDWFTRANLRQPRLSFLRKKSIIAYAEVP